MKKSVKILIIVLCLIIVGLITFIIVDKVINNKNEENNITKNVTIDEDGTNAKNNNNNDSSNNTISEKNIIDQNGIANNSVSNNNVANNNVVNNNSSSSVKSFSNDDLQINGIKLGMSGEDVIAKLGNDCTSQSYVQESSGENVTELTYKNLGLVIYLTTRGEDGIVTGVSLNNNQKIEVTRGLKISSSYDDVINSFKSESILLKESSRIVVGYPGDDPEYAVDSSKGKIYFSIKSNKVDSIRLSYGSSD